MKVLNPKLSLSNICWLFGISRQAYYQGLHKSEIEAIGQELVIKEVLAIRKNHPRIGTRKLYLMMKQFMLEHQIKMGRDALFDLLSLYKLLIRKRRRRIVTTYSNHWMKKYPNLIKEMTPTRPNHLWVSDITYWKTDAGLFYISLITDAYSHKVVGYNLAENMEAIESVKALQMAISNNDSIEGLIHHSDRGSQYCSYKYVKILDDCNVQISMTENGDPLENAIAERVNGILKEEYLDNYTVDTIVEANKLLDRVVELYNEERPHMTIGYLTPHSVHTEEVQRGEQKWKNYYNNKELTKDDHIFA